MKKNSFITVTDQFCGAGGSSQGARAAGIEVRLALNHWSRAIETHQANFPDTDHECTDISACDPRRYRSTDILITSPECTNHSLAKGQKQVQAQLSLYDKGVCDAAAERSRATMWDVCRFAEYHKYNIIIVENVVDARNWVMWEAWLMAMHSLGYLNKCVYLNSMHAHPTPQSRDRMYVVFWKKGNKAPDLDYRPAARCTTCESDVHAIQWWKDSRKPYGKYKQQYLYRCPKCSTVVEPYYYAAFNCIDWSDVGRRIGDREKPLSSNTLRRIEAGLKKYSGYPHIVNDQQSTGTESRVKAVADKLPTIPTQPHFKLIMPLVLKSEHGNIQNVRSVGETLQTQTTRQSMALVVPYIVEMNRTGECRPATGPMATVTAGGINHAMALMVENKGHSTARPVTEASSTVTTVPHMGIVTNEAWNSFIDYYYGQDTSTHISQPLGTATTKDRHSLITYQKARIEDCYYRMLKPNEIKLAMAFGKDYVVTGNSKDQVKQLGNAVTPPAMEWLVRQCVESLTK